MEQQPIEHNFKKNTTFIQYDHLDTNSYLEEMLIDEAQEKILYTTLFISITIIMLNIFAWSGLL